MTCLEFIADHCAFCPQVESGSGAEIGDPELMTLPISRVGGEV